MADESCAFYKRLASLLCEKWSDTCCCNGVALLLPVILIVTFCYQMCERPCPSAGSFYQPVLTISVGLVQAETGLTSLVLYLSV